jgi:dolichol-phosphate mannosyltransferase
MRSTSIIIPTYREKENLELLIPSLAESLENYKIEIVVVNDESLDGTYGMIDTLKYRYPVRCINRISKRGLTSAVIQGIQSSFGDNVIVMDGDGQHPVEIIAPIIDRLNTYDVVIGRRRNYSQSSIRNFASIVLNLITRPVAKTRDPMSGLFGIRRGCLPNISDLDLQSFKIGLEIFAKTRDLKRTEICYTFSARKYGQTKMTSHQLWYLLKQLIRLYEVDKFAKFCVIGTIGVAINMGILIPLVEFVKLDYRLASFVAMSTAAVCNYIGNRRWTFK